MFGRLFHTDEYIRFCFISVLIDVFMTFLTLMMWSHLCYLYSIYKTNDDFILVKTDIDSMVNIHNWSGTYEIFQKPHHLIWYENDIIGIKYAFVILMF